MYYRKVIGIFLCFTIALMGINYSIQTALQQNNIGTIISNHSIDPVIDGKLGAEEWNASEPINVLLYGRENTSYTLEIEIRSVYNEQSGNLSIGVKVSQKRIGPLNYFTMYFHTNKSVPLLSMIDNDLTVGKNNYIKEIHLRSNASIDYYASGHELVKWNDREKNCFGRALDAGDFLTAEICFPLNSGDYEGGDVMLMKGQEIDFFIFYMNTLYSNESTAYYQYNKTSMEYDVCTLKISGKTNLTAFYVLIAVPFFVLGLSAFSNFYKKDE